MAVDRRTTDPLFDRTKIIDSDHPAQPTTARFGPCPHRLSEGRLVGRRVIKDLDDLEVVPVGQRQDRIASAEAGMESAVEKRGTEVCAQPPNRLRQAFRPSRK